MLRRSTDLDLLNAVDLSEPPVCPRYKRPFDLVCGMMLLVLFAPVWIGAALLIKLTSSGPVLYRQERVGQDGRPFVMYKFRTMRHDADHSLHRDYIVQYMQGQPAADQNGVVYKLRRDPRVTVAGRVLRRLGFDELPQLVNVFRGEMSVVGPRPPLPYEVEQYSDRHRLRLKAKPGLTGLWQVLGRDIVDFETMIDMDLEYIQRQSLHFDTVLVILTLPMVVFSHLARRTGRRPRADNGTL